MTVKNTCENLSHTEESPTLHPGQRYLSLIAHVNGPLGQRLVDWKKGAARAERERLAFGCAGAFTRRNWRGAGARWGSVHLPPKL